MKTAVRSAELQRCLNGPYLFEDTTMANRLGEELGAAQEFYDRAVASFTEGDEATGLKQVWAAMYRAARGLVFKAGFRVEQLHCMRVVLHDHFGEVFSDADLDQLRIAQELVGPPQQALERARAFLDQAKRVA